ncbi:hypothetical protein ACRAWC_05820 [Leifsonia sp. L25]|uniref:hypothetical protein n=1 Tax=Actinomycetes TaxID=1760 RepID=UPI003D69D0D3
MYFTVHTLDGDPEVLLRRKREHFDPVVAEHAARFGAVSTVTIPTPTGLAVYNLWESEGGAREFTALPEIQRAQQESQLPPPSSFERHIDVDGANLSISAEK